jgi:hypothetical protein
MPVCRCCCTDYYVISNRTTATGQDVALRRVTISGQPYPNNNVTLKEAPTAPTFGSSPTITPAIDLRNKRLFAKFGFAGRQWLSTHDLRLAPIGGAVQMPLGTITPIACDWSRQKIYFVTRITSSGPPQGPFFLVDFNYEFIFWSMNYDGSDVQFLGSDFGTVSVGSGSGAANLSFLRWTPVNDRIYYGLSVNVDTPNPPQPSGDTDAFAHLKYLPATGGAPVALRSLEDPNTSLAGDAGFLDAGISTRNGQLAWIEFTSSGGTHPVIDPPIVEWKIQVSDPDATFFFPIVIGTSSAATPTPRYLHVNERENCLYYYQQNPFNGNTMRLQKVSFGGADFGTVFDTGQAGFNGAADNFLTNDLAIGCGQEYSGAAYQGDG